MSTIQISAPQIRHLYVDTNEGRFQVAFGKEDTYENLYAELAQSIGHANALHKNYIFNSKLIALNTEYQNLIGDEGKLDNLNIEVSRYRGDINQDGNLLNKIKVLTVAINQWSNKVESLQVPKKDACVIQ